MVCLGEHTWEQTYIIRNTELIQGSTNAGHFLTPVYLLCTDDHLYSS